MPRLTLSPAAGGPARVALASARVAAVSLARGLSLFAAGRPGTPLRGLCVAAFDALHTTRHGRRLPAPVLDVLAAALDFAACANAAFDHKADRRDEFTLLRHRLERTGLGPAVAEYLRRLGDLEGGRPPPCGDRRHFPAVRAYREAVVRLSLGLAAAAVGDEHGLDAAVAATAGGGELDLLFRIAMQCQVIDDVLDYPRDRASGLPTFLTACRPLPEAIELTRQACGDYARGCVDRAADRLPLRVALAVASAGAGLAVTLRRRSRQPPGTDRAPPADGRVWQPGRGAGPESRHGRAR